jgi:hypothetical protein
MIRVDVTERLRKTLSGLPPEVTAGVERALSAVAAGFGHSHRHAGLGLRKLGSRSFEVRVHLQWRVILISEPGRLTAWDVLDHEGVRRWLKSRH